MLHQGDGSSASGRGSLAPPRVVGHSRGGYGWPCTNQVLAETQATS